MSVYKVILCDFLWLCHFSSAPSPGENPPSCSSFSNWKITRSKRHEGYMKILLRRAPHCNSWAFYVPFRSWNQWLHLCVGGDRVPMRFPLSLEAGGGRRLKAIVSESSLHFPRQNNFHFSCVSCKGNVFRYVAYQMWVYKQGKVGERNCYLELAAFLVRWSRKYKPSPCLPPGFCSGHYSDLPEKVSCCKIAFEKLASLSKK